MTTTQTVLQGKDTATQGGLYMSFELGDKSWKLTMSDGRRGPSRYTVDAGDTAAVLECISKAPTRLWPERRGQAGGSNSEAYITRACGPCANARTARA